MTKFEHMKETVLNIVSALDEEELRRLVNDTDISESSNNAIFSCSLCEKTYGRCNTFYDGDDCRQRYLDWCREKWKPKVNRNAIAEAIKKYGIPNKVEILSQEGEEMNGLGARIRKLRKALHLRQSDFGEMIDVSAGYVSYLESGKEIPTKKLKMLICEKMNINMEWLETGNGDMQKNFVKIVQVGENNATVEGSGSYERMVFLISMAVAQFAREVTKELAESIPKETPGEQIPSYYEVKGELVNLLIQTIEEIN
ncbi:MAG: helix-turn-helix transcriptional regulator [Lachnospiraceae bacterium]|nr:helix-turn-helix transcriptional regulator [Lachnospiraceae bacterium]